MAGAKWTIGIVAPISDRQLARVQDVARKVLYHPGGQFPAEQLQDVDIWFTTWTGLPQSVTNLCQIPNTRLVQLSSAGANKFLASEFMQSEAAKTQVKVCSASGIHTLSIPQWIIANIVTLYMKLHLHHQIARSLRRWPDSASVNQTAGPLGSTYPGNRTLYGKTVGLLGYGHIARETARLLRAFNCNIIAANSRGTRTLDTGYIIPHTGDETASLPEAIYSTSDSDSFNAFLSRCEVLVASLPSTPQTTYMLTSEHLARLPDGAIFLNVGRGDLVSSDVIIQALNTEGGLSGVALDVTDPEPLPSGHALYSHPSAIVTGHTSGSFEGYFDAGIDILLGQIERLNRGQEPMNVVDCSKGY